MKKIAVFASVILLFGCASSNNVQTRPTEMVGAAVGALVGGYVGGKFGGGAANLIFTMLGGAVGAATGYSLASQLTPSDMARFESSTKHAMDTLEDGHVQPWNNPFTGVAGTIKPVRSYYAEDGVYCRDFEATIAVNSDIGETATRACKFAGGPWLFQGNS